VEIMRRTEREEDREKIADQREKNAEKKVSDQKEDKEK